jgi:hypothetical protein
MDNRTSQLLGALDPLSADLLLILLEKGLSEKGLLLEVDGGQQSTVHKKLARLADVGLIRPTDQSRARGVPWIVAAPKETTDLLTALLALSDALDEADKRQRARDKGRLNRAVSQNPDLRLVRPTARSIK